MPCLLRQVLLETERVDEALELCEEHGASSHHQHLVHSVLQRAGFLRLLQEQYNAAADYFLRAALDPREVKQQQEGVGGTRDILGGVEGVDTRDILGGGEGGRLYLGYIGLVVRSTSDILAGVCTRCRML